MADNPVRAQAYFLTGWLVWRYCQLYFYERTYESGGLMFEFVFNRVMICQLIFVFFTGCVFIVKRGEVCCYSGWLCLSWADAASLLRWRIACAGI